LRARATETAGAAAAIAVALEVGNVATGSAPFPRIRKKPAPPTTMAPMTTPVATPPLDRVDAGEVAEATGSRVEGPFDTTG
jgi:hypothetical protein